MLFFIDKYEVTNAQYRQCVEQGGCPLEYYTPPFHDPNYDNHPFYGYWGSGVLYCEWVGKRLPTYEEWEKAARGTDGRSYPWGDAAPTCDLANYEYCVGDTVEVGSYPDGASPYGALDMAGNMAEWVFTDPPDYQSFPDMPKRMSPTNFPIKGGYYWSVPQSLLTASSSGSPAGASFRCVASEP